MKKLIEFTPLVLLVSLVPYLFYSEPNIAQSIILSAIAGLFGYVAYLESLKKPDYVAIFTERLDSEKVETDKKLNVLLKEIEELKATQGKLNIVKAKEDKISNFKW